MKRTVDEQEESARKKVRTERVASLKSVRPSEVPEYLRDSEFYKSLNTEDDEEFHIEATYMKSNTIVETMEDACNLLQTVRYWGLEAALIPVVKFALTESIDTLERNFSEFKNEFPLVRVLLHAVDGRNPRENRMERAMEFGSVELVQYLESVDEPISMDALALAAGNGHVECLQYALQRPIKGGVQSAGPVYNAAAHGQLACLKVLENSTLSISAHRRQFGSYGISIIYWTAHVMSTSAENGHLECLQYLHRAGCAIHCHGAAAAGGSLPCLQYCMDHENISMQWGASVTQAAAKNGHIHCLEFLETRGHHVTQDMFTDLAASGSLKGLQYFLDRGCAWSFEISHAAALNGHVEFLKHVCAHGCELLPDEIALYSRPYQTDYQSRGRWRTCNDPFLLVELVAGRHHWDCVEFLVQQGYPLTRTLTAYLAQHNQDALLRQVVERGYTVGVQAAVNYATNGNLQGLVYALDHGTSPSVQIACAAARGGHRECLEYAHQRGCPLQTEVCTSAARGGHLDCLQYAREHGCPWDGSVRRAAEKRGHSSIVEYATANNCPVRKSKPKAAYV